jgi:pilus assembly protein Flp/PilA
MWRRCDGFWPEVRRSGASHHFALFNAASLHGAAAIVKHCERGYIIMSKFLSYLRDENGASAAEYALILAIIGAILVLAMFLLGGAINTAINKTANCLTNASSTGC